MQCGNQFNNIIRFSGIGGEWILQDTLIVFDTSNWSERLDNGSGVDYQRVPVFTIYMGDTNTQGGVGKLQVKLSTNGTLTNAGSYINIQLR